MPFLPGVAPSIRGEELNIASALLKQVLVLQDFETWTCVRKDYLPNEYHSLFSAIDKQKNFGRAYTNLTKKVKLLSQRSFIFSCLLNL